MSKIYKNVLVPIPEGAYISKSDARVYLVREKVYLPDKHYNNDKREVIGRAVSEKEMYPNSAFRWLFPEIFNACSTEEPVPSILKTIGPYAAFLAIGRNLGLYELLIRDFGPQYANAIMDYSVYSILSQSDVSKDFRASMDRYLLFSDTVYGESWLSGFFKNGLQDSQAWNFRNDWAAKCRERGVEKAWICIDGSNNDCDADKNVLAEKGKPKSHGGGDVVGYMWAVDSRDGTPITYSIYRGGQVDSKALREIIASLEANGVGINGVILDRGFCDIESLRLLSGSGIPYLAMLKGNINAHKVLAERYGKELRLNNVRYLLPGSGMYGVSEKARLFSSKPDEAYVSLYYDSRNGVERVNHLTDKVKEEISQALTAVSEGKKVSVSADCRKYINIVRKGRGTRIEINEDVLQEAVDSKGFSCIASSIEMTAAEKADIYRLRQASEKQYAIFKSQLGYDTLRVHTTENWMSKFAVGFIAGIMRNEFENVCRRLKVDTNVMLKELTHLHISLLPDKDYRMIHTENARQTALLKELGIWITDLEDIAFQENKRMNEAVHSPIHSLPDHGETEVRRGPGRPKGSKNKKQKEKKAKRSPGRPKGSKNKKTPEKEAAERRGPGRPKGSKNKPKK